MTTPHACPRCNASGQIPTRAPMVSSASQMMEICPPCGGTGILWSHDKTDSDRLAALEARVRELEIAQDRRETWEQEQRERA